MSRIAKKPIQIPEKTDVTVEGNEVRVKGPNGELVRTFRPIIDIAVEDGTVTVRKKSDSKQARALWGTYASHIRNMMEGVNRPFEKKLEVNGIGYRVNVSGGKLVLSVGYSHDVELSIPDGLDVSVEKNVITISGINKEEVGLFAAQVRDVRKPEPYKGKGIKYSDEVIRRKEGKRAV